MLCDSSSSDCVIVSIIPWNFFKRRVPNLAASKLLIIMIMIKIIIIVIIVMMVVMMYPKLLILTPLIAVMTSFTLTAFVSAMGPRPDDNNSNDDVMMMMMMMMVMMMMMMILPLSPSCGLSNALILQLLELHLLSSLVLLLTRRILA